MNSLTWTSDLEAARAGDRPALERVLTHSRQDLRRYAEHHCVINDAEDAVQEALFTASRRMADLRSLECFTSWLFRIVKRECNRLKRGVRGFMHQPITDDIADTCHVESRGLARDLAAAMESLPAHYRENELSQTLGLTIEATKARLHRARSLAREYLSS